MTSAAVTNTIKRILLKDFAPSSASGRRRNSLKVGHGGTLDRLADGVLVVGVSEGCKRLNEFLHGSKEYNALGCIGKATDTLDADGEVTEEKLFGHVTESLLRDTVASFIGEQKQTPPIYSALKQDGQRLSDLVRAGSAALIDIERKQRMVTIHRIQLLSFSPPTFRILVECSSGTYIRSLVRDIGEQLGTVAHLQHLCRTRQGQFRSEEALREDDWTIDEIRLALQRSTSQDRHDSQDV